MTASDEDATNAAAFGASVRMSEASFVATARTAQAVAVNVQVAARVATAPALGKGKTLKVN